MRQLLLFVLIALSPLNAFCQITEWFNTGTNSQNPNGQGTGISDMVTDVNGDIIVIGNYYYDSTISNEFAGAKLKKYDAGSCFIAKLDGGSGTLKWIKTGGDLSKNIHPGYAGFSEIEIDNRGVIHFSGFLFGNATIEGHQASGAKGEINNFIGTCDNDGNILGIKYFFDWYIQSATTPRGFAPSIFRVDADGSYVFTFGISYKDRIIGKGLNYYNSSGAHQSVLIKFDSSMKFLWMNKDSLTHQGYQHGAIDIDKDNNIYAYVYRGAKGWAFEKYNSNGILLKNKKVSTNRDTFYLHGLVVDENMNLYSCGMAKGIFSFAGKNYDVKYEMAILIKLDSNFNEIWLKGSNEPYWGFGQSLSNNEFTNNIFSYVVFVNQINFGASNRSKKHGERFIGGFKPDGTNFWSKSDNPNSEVYSISYNEDKCGSLYVGISGFSKNFIFDDIDYSSKNVINSGTATSQAIIKYKFDTAKFIIRNKTTYCESIVLSSDFDTSYHKLYWFYDGEIIDSFKNTITIPFSKTGKYPITLLGIKDNGCQYSHTDTITYIQRPQAKYSHKDTVGCQWLGYQFTNQSSTDTINLDKGESFLWTFGDGTKDTARNPLHIYTKSGKFKVTLIYSNGFCTDTFTQEETVEILAAPKPGFYVNDTIGCVPFTVEVKDNSQGSVTKYNYTFGKEFQSLETNPTYTFTKPGVYYITQKLLGSTGCITTDSISIRIKDGILPTESPTMLRATFNDANQVEISWEKHSLAEYYSLYKQHYNSTFQVLNKHLLDTVYVDSDIQLSQPFYYFLIATDSCGNLSSSSLIAKPIILKGENKENKYILLDGTQYQKWQNGVNEYVLEIKDQTGNFIPITNSIQVTHIDSLRNPNEFLEQCYRLKAIERNGNKQVSYSNEVCVDHLPQVFIPNTFSPNNDGLNDLFKVYTIGIKEYTISIYNRWGELIFSGSKESGSWDGKFKNAICPDGVYLYKIHARSIGGENVIHSGEVKIFR